MPQRAHRLLIPLAALLAVLPLLITGPSCGHDFDFHILSWLEAATQFTHLHYPHWAYTPAYNAGEPRFLFYPPLSWSLGAVLGLVLPWKLVPAAFTWIALILSGFTMHALARRYASPNAATLAAVLYLANPYMLFTAYERTAYGELLAAAWLPLLFLAAFAQRIRIVPLAIPIALLWLTNAPAAVMSCYTLAILTLLRLTLPNNDLRHTERSEEPLSLPSSRPQSPGAPSIAPLSSAMGGKYKSSRTRIATTTIAATLLGLTLASFYLIPAIHERPFIQSDMVLLEGMRIADNTLFHHMSPATEDNLAHDVVLHTASVIAVIILAAILLAAATLWMPHPREARVGIGDAGPSTSVPLVRAPKEHPLIPLLFLTLLIAILLTPISLPIWAHTPQLRFLQFPWRLTAILGAILALVTAKAFNRLNLKPIPTAIASIALAAALILPAWQLFHQHCDDEDTVEARVALYHSDLGTDPTDEYTPATADNDSLGHADPPYWLGLNASTPSPANSKPGQSPTHLVLALPTPAYLILNRRAFPDERVTLNRQPITPEIRDDGLIAVPLPAGHDTLDLTQHPTPDQTAGLVLTALALLATFTLRNKAGALPARS